MSTSAARDLDRLLVVTRLLAHQRLGMSAAPQVTPDSRSATRSAVEVAMAGRGGLEGQLVSSSSVSVGAPKSQDGGS